MPRQHRGQDLGHGGFIPDESREDLIRELQQWRYVPEPQSSLMLHEDLINFVPGSFDEVTDASLDGQIDE